MGSISSYTHIRHCHALCVSHSHCTGCLPSTTYIPAWMLCFWIQECMQPMCQSSCASKYPGSNGQQVTDGDQWWSTPAAVPPGLGHLEVCPTETAQVAQVQGAPRSHSWHLLANTPSTDTTWVSLWRNPTNQPAVVVHKSEARPIYLCTDAWCLRTS